MPSRRGRRAGGALAAVCCAVVVMAGPAGAVTRPTPSTRPPTAIRPAPRATPTPAPTVAPEPAARILVDLDTGAILDAKGDRVARPPASLTKVLTATTVMAHLDHSATVPVSARAAGEPAAKIDMKAGQVWPVDQAVHSLLMVSANDAAMALAEKVGGTAEGFQADFDAQAKALGLADAPVLRDPAGLDDQFSVGGGNLISARDLAIASRALLADPWLATVTATRKWAFTGPDGRPHTLTNHNKLLVTYPGAIGLKTGYTKKSGRTLIAAATRNGRTMLAVVMDVYDTDGWATRMLDQGFATTVAAEATMEHLGSAPKDAGGEGTSGGSGKGTKGSVTSRSLGPLPVHSAVGRGRSPGVMALGAAAAAVLAALAAVAVRRRRSVGPASRPAAAAERAGGP